MSPFTFLLIVVLLAVWSNSYNTRSVFRIETASFQLSTCILQNQWYRVFTAPIVHNSLSHLIVNVLAVWLGLSRIENVYGTWFVFRYTLLLFVGEAIFTLVLVKMSVEFFRKRHDINQSCRSLYENLSLSQALLCVRRFNVQNIRSAWLRCYSGLHLYFTENATSNSSSDSALPDHLPEVEMDRSQDDHPFAHLLSNPLAREPVCGMNGLCLAWLTFAAVQVGSEFSLEPLPSAVNLPMTQTFMRSNSAKDVNASGTGEQRNAFWAKAALANTDYSVLGLFGLDPALAPLVFLLLTRLTHSGHRLFDTTEMHSDSRLHSTSAANVRYILQSMCGFLLGILLGFDVLTLLPNVYWTCCFLLNCFLLCFNSFASNNARILREALDRQNIEYEPILNDAQYLESNLFGLDLAPETFDQPSSDLRLEVSQRGMDNRV
jgi:hypothetical protein